MPASAAAPASTTATRSMTELKAMKVAQLTDLAR
jgi:hypothetical protein